MLRIKNTHNSVVSSRLIKEFKKNKLNFLQSSYYIIIGVLFFFITACNGQSEIIVAANSTESYIHLLKSKKVAIVANQTSVIFKNSSSLLYTHLVDSLLARNIHITNVFSPEHGFRGKSDAAEHVANRTDTKTGLPIISLYGKNKKPSSAQLKSIDMVLFDIQDVGVRFYTYISTLHYVMEACAENNIPLIVLDRPNPNAHYIDGPTLNIKYKSFVGMHPVPLVYGMTIGEYAKMINGEQWLKNKIICDLTVIPLKNYTHKSTYNLPILPSPNLPNSKSINLYPSLGFFEGTPINAGRGTEFQFQRFGSSKFEKTNFSYSPKANFGSKHPKDQNMVCYGFNLKNEDRLNKVSISWLKKAYDLYPNKEAFFGKTFTIHAGNKTLRKQLENNFPTKKIEDSWKTEIEKFKFVREKYVMYE
ncbi:DUF1343 domain-containing protein [Flavicella sp.]|uniref:exo-beta-N-acetylmuramidase NamZ family protein n=1 Tax=Flavicella sp. TaxID=2957742 RepID=UPI00301776DF